LKLAFVVSTYNQFVTERLEAAGRTRAIEAGMAEGDIATFRVPGAFELPQAAERVAESGEWQAIVCLGCLIKGETPHFDFIAQAVADGITRAAQTTGVPIAFGVLTTNTAEEALARAGDGASNKGREATEAALSMAALYASLDHAADRAATRS
jgi:6,7-dimethyl-8-ribityllumazine synthase